MPARALPSMRLSAADVFVCSNIGEPTPAPRRRGHLAAVPPPAPSGWLVLALCPRCHPHNGGHYCQDHRRDNWWLTKSHLGR